MKRIRRAVSNRLLGRKLLPPEQGPQNPDCPPATTKGKERHRILQDLWLDSKSSRVATVGPIQTITARLCHDVVTLRLYDCDGAGKKQHPGSGASNRELIYIGTMSLLQERPNAFARLWPPPEPLEMKRDPLVLTGGGGLRGYLDTLAPATAMEGNWLARGGELPSYFVCGLGGVEGELKGVGRPCPRSYGPTKHDEPDVRGLLGTW